MIIEIAQQFYNKLRKSEIFSIIPSGFLYKLFTFSIIIPAFQAFAQAIFKRLQFRNLHRAFYNFYLIYV